MFKIGLKILEVSGKLVFCSTWNVANERDDRSVPLSAVLEIFCAKSQWLKKPAPKEKTKKKLYKKGEKA